MTQEATGIVNEYDDLILDNVDAGSDDIEVVTRLDSRGEYTIGSGIVIAVGKTFRSGRLNIPVNAFYIPGKNTQRYGISFDFNINSKKR